MQAVGVPPKTRIKAISRLGSVEHILFYILFSTGCTARVMALTILHFADLHLGVENYGRLDPATGLHSRVRDFSSARYHF